MTIIDFVEDLTNQVNIFHDNDVSAETLAEKMTQDCQHWANLLLLSGGPLELEKCLYHFIQFEFHPDSTPFMSPNYKGPPIKIATKTTTKLLLSTIQSMNPIKYWAILKHP